MAAMKLFKPNVTLNVELENFNDEDAGAEKFMEVLGYYQIGDVGLTKCQINGKSTVNYLIGPAKQLRGSNSQV